MPVIKELVMTIIEVQSKGMDPEPFVNLLRESIKRFDERLDVEQFIPKAPALPAPAMPGAMPGAPMPPALAAMAGA